MKAIRQTEYGTEPEEVLRLAEDGRTHDRRRRGTRARPRGERGPRHLAPHDRPAVPHPRRRLRAARAEGAESRAEPCRDGRVRRQGRDASSRRATRCTARATARSPSTRAVAVEQARAQAGEPLVRAGRGRARSRRSPRCRRCATRRRCRRGRRCLIVGASVASGPSPCRSPRRSALRSPACAAPRRWSWSDPSAPTTSSTTRATTSPTARRRYDVILDIGGNRRLSHLRRALTHDGNARHRRRRDRWPVARRLRPLAARGAAVAVREPEARHAGVVGERRRPDCAQRAASRPARSPR